MKKRAAMELSISTIVIVVLAMAMLILGVMLIQSIFKASKYNVDTLNDQVSAAIKKLFVNTEQAMAFYLPSRTAEVPQGEVWGVAFGVSNSEPTAGKFTYASGVDIGGVSAQLCPGITANQANDLIILGKTGSLGNIQSGESKEALLKINIPTGFPVNCQIRYRVFVKKDGIDYADDFFDLKVRKKFAGLF